MSLGPTARWVGLALLGLAIAVAVAVAGSRLVSRQIGLSSEPIRAGDALAPRVSGAGSARRPRPAPPTTDASPPAGEPAPTPPSSQGSENDGTDHDADD